ncbi:MAG: hypothetical protein M3P91_11045 [Actinomycetota bacterium]|nr:hypothetical protein [Actinomycetota bacterium]
MSSSHGPDSGSPLALRLSAAGCGLGALGCLAIGLYEIIYFARTRSAMADERTGQLLIAVAVLALVGVAAVASR